MKKLLSIALISSVGFSYTLFMPYGSYVDYSKKISKEKAYDGGVYLSYFKWPFKVELGGEYLDIKYKSSSNINDYIEKDATFVFNNYIGKNYLIKAGIRDMFVKQDSYDNNKVWIAGILYYEYLKYNLGVDYYYSSYNNFNVKQFTPHFGFNFGNYYSDIGSFYLDTKVNFIKISNQIKANSRDDNYVDMDIALSNYKGPWTTTLKGTFGRSSYKVSNGGFVVYNLGDEYKYSFGLDISYRFNKFNTLTIGYKRDKFIQNNIDAFSNSYLLTYSLSF